LKTSFTVEELDALMVMLLKDIQTKRKHPELLEKIASMFKKGRFTVKRCAPCSAREYNITNHSRYKDAKMAYEKTLKTAKPGSDVIMYYESLSGMLLFMESDEVIVTME